MFITSVDGMPRPSPLLSCRPNVHFFIVEAVESRYGQRAAYTDETRKFLFAHTPPQKRSAADTRSEAHRGGLQSRRGTIKIKSFEKKK